MAASTFVIGGWMPARGRDGQPVIARLRFYLNNTNTPTNVYTDATLTTPLSQPVTSDSSGRFPGIWADNALLFAVAYDDDDGQSETLNDVRPGTSIVAPTLAIGTVSSGTPAAASITGTSPNYSLNLTIPPGTPGTNGSAATIAVGTVTTGAPGSSVSITNVGTSSAAIFNFSIPQGAPGDVSKTGTPTAGQFAKWSSASVLTAQTGINNSDWSGTQLSVPNGGTGLQALTANALLVGNGTSAVSLLAAGSNLQVLTVVGGVPTWQNLAGTPFTTIQTDTISSPIAQSTSPDLTGYNEVSIGLLGVTTVTAGNLAVRFSSDGTTYNSTPLVVGQATPNSGGLRGGIYWPDIRSDVGVILSGVGDSNNSTLSGATATGANSVKIGWSAAGGIKRIRVVEQGGANFNAGAIVWRAR